MTLIVGSSSCGKSSFINIHPDTTFIEAQQLPEENPRTLLVMFDCMSLESFIFAKQKIIEAHHRWNDVRIVVIGNKTDVGRKYSFNLEQFDRFCRQMFINLIMVSCRTGYRTDKPLLKLSESYQPDEHTICNW